MKGYAYLDQLIQQGALAKLLVQYLLRTDDIGVSQLKGTHIAAFAT